MTGILRNWSEILAAYETFTTDEECKIGYHGKAILTATTRPQHHEFFNETATNRLVPKTISVP